MASRDKKMYADILYATSVISWIIGGLWILSLLFGLVDTTKGLMTAFVFVISGFLISLENSRIAAVGLFVFAIIFGIYLDLPVFMNLVTGKMQAGSSLIVAGLVLRFFLMIALIITSFLSIQGTEVVGGKKK